ncbi:DUF4190 domain-containing protein [Microbacteriaceae bacterium VKM Ac-2855]|nr:DUF4190 domain-containing protein [Microbacteriaceae bacterium VKM Ac-2855]
MTEPSIPPTPPPYGSPAAGSDPVAPPSYSAPAPPAYAAPGGGPGAPYGSPPPTGPRRFNGLGLAALICGGIALLGSFIPFLNYLTGFLAFVGLVLGIIGLVLKGRAKGLAVAGTIVSAVALVLSIVLAIVYTAGIASSVSDAIASAEASAEATFPTDEALPSDAATDPGLGEEAPVGGADGAFGDTIAYDNNVTISVSAPSPFTPSETAFGADQANQVLVTMTITNGSAENLEPSVYATASSAGVAATDIYDSGNAAGDVGASPTTTILPGGTATWVQAFSVADPADIVLQISPSFDYDDVIFSTTP